jgi:hypothetical protein
MAQHSSTRSLHVTSSDTLRRTLLGFMPSTLSCCTRTYSSSTKTLRGCLTSSLPWKKHRRKQNMQSSPSLTLNWPCRLLPPFSSRATTRRDMDEWEGCSAAMKTWAKWKQAYLAAYGRGINRQCAGATDEPFIQAANLVTLPAAHDMMDVLTGLLDNLALAATTDRTTVQQLMVANLSLKTLVTTLTAANKKLTKMVACYNPGPQGCSRGTGCGGNKDPLWPHSNLGQLLLVTWVQGIAYQQNLQCDW